MYSMLSVNSRNKLHIGGIQMEVLIILILVIIFAFREIGDVFDKLLSNKKDVELTIKYSHKE